MNIIQKPRKLNLSFAKDLAKSAGAAAAAVVYEEVLANALVNHTGADGKTTFVEGAIQVVAGWGPIFAAGYAGGPVAAAYAGATLYNRLDNLAVILGLPATTVFGHVSRGQTIDQADARYRY